MTELTDAEIRYRRKLYEAQDPAGTPTIVSQRGPRHKAGPKYRSNEDILREQAIKMSEKYGFELTSLEEPEPVEEVVEEPIIEEPKPTFTEKKQEFLEAGLDEASANRMSAEFIQEDNLPVEQPVEREIVDDGSELLSRIAQMQRAPTQHKAELDEAMAEARQRGLLR